MNPDKTHEQKYVWAVSIALVLAVAAVFGQTGWFTFVNYDDQSYVSDNPVVEQGLTLHGVQWALTYGEIGPWHPLTWLTLMLDEEMYGLWAGGYHLTNVALHALTAVLLFLVLRRMTGALWRGALVAAVFAVHPLRAESVAWVTERKDVLSGVFFMLTLLAYARYVEKPRTGRSLTVALTLCAGLLAKSMLVTTPCVLLLLDYWPLGRMRGERGEFWAKAGKLAAEKLPLFILSAGVCLITLRTPDHNDQPLAWPLRLENAVVGPMMYLKEMAWPEKLFLPHANPTQDWPVPEVALAAALLAGITAAAWRWRRERPYLIVGWAWFLGMLGPVLGIIPARFAYADRYTYLPGIGVAIALTWGAAELAARWRAPRWLPATVAALVLSAMGAQAWHQTGYWRDSETLWRHTLACMPDNAMANYNLAETLGEQGRAREALPYLRRAHELLPTYPGADLNLGNLLLELGQTDQAIACLRQVVKNDPDNARAHYDLGNMFRVAGQLGEAAVQFQQAMSLRPDFAQAMYNLGNVRFDQGHLAEALVLYEKALAIQPDMAQADYNAGNALYAMGKMEAAIGHYRQALANKPDYFDAHNNLGSALVKLGRNAEAMTEYRQALVLQPNNLRALNTLAWLLATQPANPAGAGAEAVELAERARRLTRGNDPLTLRTLAAAYAQTGRFAEAKQAARAGQQLAQAAGNTDLADAINAELAEYANNLPHRETGKPAGSGR